MLKATSSSDCRDDRAFTRPQSGTLAVRHTRAPAMRIASAVNVPAGTFTRSVPTRATEGRARACGAWGSLMRSSGTSMGCCPASIRYMRSMPWGSVASARTSTLDAETIPPADAVMSSSQCRPSAASARTVARTRRSSCPGARTRYSAHAPGRGSIRPIAAALALFTLWLASRTAVDRTRPTPLHVTFLLLVGACLSLRSASGEPRPLPDPAPSLLDALQVAADELDQRYDGLYAPDAAQFS